MYEIRVPEAGFSVKEATIIEWTKSAGDRVQAGETVVIVETDKVVVEIPALSSGVLIEIRFGKGETVAVGALLGLIAEESEGEVLAASAFETVEPPASAFTSPSREGIKGPAVGEEPKRRISPVARKMAKSENIDLSEIEVGSGPGGRIVKEDVLNLIKRRTLAERPIEGGKKAETTEKVLFTGWRKTIADRMIASAGIPQGRTIIEVDVTELAALIDSTRKGGQGPRITYLPFLMKSMQAGIDLVPEINAYCYDDGYVLQKEINIGVAVEVGEKLVVPVVKGVREKSILELSEEIQEVVRKARSETLRPEDVQGGTITITNLGPFDVYAAEPLLLEPQTTIVAMGTVRAQPCVAVDGGVEVRKKVMITGVFDHRAINGAPGARFLGRLKEMLEDLNRMMLSLR